MERGSSIDSPKVSSKGSKWRRHHHRFLAHKCWMEEPRSGAHSNLWRAPSHVWDVVGCDAVVRVWVVDVDVGRVALNWRHVRAAMNMDVDHVGLLGSCIVSQAG
ncbi:hypothetical protein H310_04981 [Aphanomyces invadans]|uniref:Uncharacterized protein n=1 Tax=Aphanomyces invadans TaxID=157072 RepID=A0A024UCE9_9STRA|nr:hypothetical protein H310_04981 [Aphanomyces invadans]ETW03567.1 hypothetical protein H310_04981 [Aphanomyces invadans]|eukprot:XP_008867796.1 hypothetical protein H310_04981 [Aphanomyces invadans]